MYCKYCGTENTSDTKFCTNCGASLAEENTQNTYEQPTYSQPEYSQPNYNQPNYNQNQYANYNPAYQNKGQDGKGFAIAGIVCGAVGIILWVLMLIGGLI